MVDLRIACEECGEVFDELQYAWEHGFMHDETPTFKIGTEEALM